MYARELIITGHTLTHTASLWVSIILQHAGGTAPKTCCKREDVSGEKVSLDECESQSLSFYNIKAYTKSVPCIYLCTNFKYFSLVAC